MKVYKLDVMIIDHDNVGEEGIKRILESTRYPNHAISPTVMDVKIREIWWSDEHPLNNEETQEAEYVELFRRQ